MDATVDPARVEALFDLVLDLPHAQALEVLDAECARAPDLRAAVERLLEHDLTASTGFLQPNPEVAAAALDSAAMIFDESPNLDGSIDEAGRVGRFLVLRRLGQGAMGVVYVAYDESLERRVALKVLRHDVEFPEFLAREAKALARVAHPNVVQIYETGIDQGRPFVAMEFVSGRSLREWLNEESRASTEVLRVFLEAGRGLSAAHEVGLVHRDFKPDNVLVGFDGRVRVVDFGVAAMVGGTAEGLMGTPAFMAPEQFLGERATAATDQFGFCAALYRALFGVAPFDGKDVPTLRQNVISGALRAPPPTTNVPGWVTRVLSRGLAREPATRFPTMRDLLGAIERRLASSELDPNLGRRERRAVAGVMGILGAGLLGALWIRSAARDRPTMRELIIAPAVAVFVLTVAAIVLRRRLLANRYARSVVIVVWLSAVTVVIHRLLAIRFGEPVPAVVAVDLFALGMQHAMAAVLFDRCFVPPTALFLGAATIATIEPAWALAAMFGSVTAAYVVGASWWARDT